MAKFDFKHVKNNFYYIVIKLVKRISTVNFINYTSLNWKIQTIEKKINSNLLTLYRSLIYTSIT